MIPSTITTCDLRLIRGVGITSALNGRISAWADQSGAGNNATAASGTQPLALGGLKNGVQFANDSFMSLPSTLSQNDQNFTFWAVTEDEPTGTAVGCLWGSAAADATTYLFQYAAQNTTFYAAASGGGNTTRATNLPAFSSKTVTVMVSSSTGVTTYSHKAIGASQPQMLAGTKTALLLGASGAGGANYRWGGTIVEAGHCSTALSALQVNDLISMLVEQYEIKPARIRLIVDGNSIPQGTNAQYGLIYHNIMDLGEPVDKFNVALSGAQIGQLANAFGTTNPAVGGRMAAQAGIVIPLLDNSYPTTIVHVHDISNDIDAAGGNVTAAVAWQRIGAYCQGIRTASPSTIIILSTPLARPLANGGSGGTFEVDRQAYITLARTGASWFDGLADFAAHPLIGTATAPANPVLFDGNQIHPLTISHGIMAGILANAIKKAITPAPINNTFSQVALSLTVTISGSTRILNWTADPAATSYLVSWIAKSSAPSVGDSFVEIASVPTGTLTYSDTDATRNSTAGYYTVTALH